MVLFGVAIAWQFAFCIITQDVQRLRNFMLPAVLEKLSFGAATLVLYARGWSQFRYSAPQQ